jgi:hypothetical protein
MTKKELIAALSEKNVEFDPNSTKAELIELYNDAPDDTPEGMQEKIDTAKAEKKERLESVSQAPAGCKWISADKDKVEELQRKGELIGFNPVKQEALVSL